MFSLKNKFNFKIGQPPDELMYPEFLEKSFLNAMEKLKDTSLENYNYRFLNYGESRGDVSLRTELANFITKDLSYTVNKDDLFITNGVSHGLDLLCTALLKPGDNVLIEGPTYFLCMKIFEDHHLNNFTVRRDEKGEIDLEELEKVVKENNIKAFYVIPNCHNPIGCRLPLEQRNKIYNLSLQYKFYLFCDDIYEMFYINENQDRLPPLFVSSDEVVKGISTHRKEVKEHKMSYNPYAISINSFNKLMNPGVRLGWMVADTHVIEKLLKIGFISSGGGVNNTMNHVLCSYIQLGFLEKMIHFTRENFNNRVNKVDEILQGSTAYDYDSPKWGYFYWIKLNDKVDIDVFKKKMEEEDLHVLFGISALQKEYAQKEEYKYLNRRIRICFVRYDLNRVLEGCKVLRRILEESVKN